jgi:hypothetical protein
MKSTAFVEVVKCNFIYPYEP